MRYFGHVSPDMTLHYAITRSQTMEEEFLKYKKVTRDGRTAQIDGTDLYELLHLDKRADRILPTGWCSLPPKQLCNKGNACLTCSKFVTNITHAPELRRQLDATERLVATRQDAFTAKYGCNQWATTISGSKGAEKKLIRSTASCCQLRISPSAVSAAPASQTNPHRSWRSTATHLRDAAQRRHQQATEEATALP